MGIFLKWVASFLLIGLLVSTHIVFSKFAELTSKHLAAAKSDLHTHHMQDLTRPQITPPVQVRKILSRYDRKIFFRHLKSRFPRYQKHFQNAALKYDVPWKLLASQAYQESHWNRRARSPTGVRGIMMLTRRTAASLGIRNRLDPRKSIYGGAQYLTIMQQRIPDSVPVPDRTFFALAAYNVGLGHVKDARILALRKKKSPDRWQDMMQILPLLNQKKYYRTLPHGYARGPEPVTYVQRIRAYQILLDEKTAKNSYVTNQGKRGKMHHATTLRTPRRMPTWMRKDTGV